MYRREDIKKTACKMTAVFLVLIVAVFLSLVKSLHVGGQVGGKKSIEMPPNNEVVGAAEVSSTSGCF